MGKGFETELIMWRFFDQPSFSPGETGTTGEREPKKGIPPIRGWAALAFFRVRPVIELFVELRRTRPYWLMGLAEPPDLGPKKPNSMNDRR